MIWRDRPDRPSSQAILSRTPNTVKCSGQLGGLVTFAEELHFKLNLHGRDVGMLLCNLGIDVEMQDAPSDENPVSRELRTVTHEVEERVRAQIEIALGRELVEQLEEQAERLHTGRDTKWTKQRYEIAFALSPRDVGILLNLASKAVDDASLFLEDDEEGENVRFAMALLDLFRTVHRGIEKQLGAAMAADLEEQVSHLYAGVLDEILGERNWQ